MVCDAYHDLYYQAVLLDKVPVASTYLSLTVLPDIWAVVSTAAFTIRETPSQTNTATERMS